MVLQKNFFFFSPATRSFKTTLEGNFSFCSDCSENRSDLLGKYLLFGKLNNTLHDTRKKFFLCKTCRMSKLLWNFLWKKKLLHRTQQFSFQNSFTICCSFFVVFSPTLKKTRLFCFGNLAQNRPWDASWITHDPRHSSKKTAEVVSVLEPEKSAHKVQRHLKNDLLLFTPLKENLQS